MIVRNVFAQPQPAASASPSAHARDVDVTILAGGNEANPLMDSVRELFGRLGLAVNPHILATPDEAPDAGPSSTGLSVRIDLASRYEAVIIVRNNLVEVRRTISRDASPTIVREEIADAVRSVVEAQFLPDESRQTASAAPVAAPVVASPPEPPPPAAPPTAETLAPQAPGKGPWFALDLTVLAGGGPIDSDSTFVAHVGGGLVFGSRRGRRPSLTLTATYLVPFENSFANSFASVASHTSVWSLRAVPAIEVAHASWIALDVGAGGGVDIVSLAAVQSSAPSMTKIGAVGTQVDPILTALAKVDVDLAPGVAFSLVVGSDFDFIRPVLYVVNTPGNNQGDLLAPWHVRPMAMAGFTFTALGTGLFATRGPP